jgi:lysozyme
MTNADSPANALRTSDQGIDLIKQYQVFLTTPRKAPCGLFEIGYGHVLRPVDQKLALVTERQAEQLLREDVRCFEIYLNATVRVPLKQHEFDALVSLVFDVGMLAFEHSPLRRLINDGHRPEAAQELRAWRGGPFGNRSAACHHRRRHDEARLFLHGTHSAYSAFEDEHFATFCPD